MPAGGAIRYRLRHRSQDLDVALGEFVVGRSHDCQLSLDDPLVSRRHATFLATAEQLTVEDLGSRNGVLVNGNKIAGRAVLSNGDVVTIGGTDLVVEVVGANAGEAARRKVAVTMTQEAASAGSAMALLSGVLEKALAMGRIDEAERILQSLLTDTLAGLQNGTRDQAALEQATRYALRVASESGKSQWIDWVFQAHHAAAKVVPTATVDELYALVRKVRYPVTPALRSYVSTLRAQADKLSPTERFALQRIEGLVRVLLA